MNWLWRATIVDDRAALAAGFRANVDCASPGRVDPFSRRIEPQIVDPRHARKLGDDSDAVNVDRDEPAKLKRGAEQSTVAFVERQRVAVLVPLGITTLLSARPTARRRDG